MEEKAVVLTSELEPLISALKNEMQKRGYSPVSIMDLERVWMLLAEYASSVPVSQFNEKFRSDFLRAEYGLRMDMEDTMYRANRAMALLTNYANYGVVAGFPKRVKNEFSEGYRELLTAFMDGEARRGLAEGSIKSLRSRLFRLNVFLTDKGAEAFCMVQRNTINDFIKYLAPYSTTYVSENLRMLRRLCTFAFQHGYHSEDLSICVPSVKNSRQQKIPAVFTTAEVESILASFDRDNPIGKRNYAIFLLAARLGLRSSDIRALEFGFINWKEKVIAFSQQKTKKFLRFTEGGC